MALKRKRPDDAAMNELLSRVWIYRRDDLTTIFANISEMAKIWYNLTVYDQMADGSPRSKLLFALGRGSNRSWSNVERRIQQWNTPPRLGNLNRVCEQNHEYGFWIFDIICEGGLGPERKPSFGVPPPRRWPFGNALKRDNSLCRRRFC
jgi:hypothetical protein